MEQLPGVQSVALTSVVPLSGSSAISSVAAEGQPRNGSNRRGGIDAGHRDQRRVDASPLAELTPREVIGKRIDAVPTRRKDLPRWEVVGVIADLHDAALTQTPMPEMHTPFTQTADAFWPYLGRSMVVAVRLSQIGARPESIRQELQRAIARVDPSLPLADAKSMEGYLAQTLATARMNTWLVSTLSAIALVLAMVGIYGVVSYFVSQRTQEIGIRIALGSTPSGIWQFVVRRGMGPVGAGLVVGVGLSLATSRLLQSQLFGVTTRDPLTLVGVAILVTLVAIVAMYFPARRAMRVSPVVSLSSS